MPQTSLFARSSSQQESYPAELRAQGSRRRTEGVTSESVSAIQLASNVNSASIPIRAIWVSVIGSYLVIRSISHHVS